MDRRKFLSWIGLGFLVTSVPTTIVSCQSDGVSSEEKTAETAAAESKSTNSPYVIGTVADLDAKGVLSGKPDFAKSTVLVIRNPNARDTLFALNASCPHQGCDVEWKADRSEFVCPCHSGRFAPDGALLGGPPKTPLGTYVARIEGTQVVVTAA
ncbi:MAG: ubiquinol-cytochrome c reductase iron-sulfur subunit [Prochlorotrichaceae cyanobacterium]|jgi:cytochrome b6-f complex iron-sulfur subunit